MLRIVTGERKSAQFRDYEKLKFRFRRQKNETDKGTNRHFSEGAAGRRDNQMGVRFGGDMRKDIIQLAERVFRRGARAT